MLLLLRTAALTGSATVGLTHGLSGTLSDVSTLTASATLDLACGLTGSGVASASQPGPLDSPTISTGAYRKKRKRKALQAVEIAAQAPEARATIAPLAVPVRMDFEALAQVTGQTLEALRAEVDSEIADLLAEADERDDEEAIALILALID